MPQDAAIARPFNYRQSDGTCLRFGIAFYEGVPDQIADDPYFRAHTAAAVLARGERLMQHVGYRNPPSAGGDLHCHVHTLVDAIAPGVPPEYTWPPGYGPAYPFGQPGQTAVPAPWPGPNDVPPLAAHGTVQTRPGVEPPIVRFPDHVSGGNKRGLAAGDGKFYQQVDAYAPLPPGVVMVENGHDAPEPPTGMVLIDAATIPRGAPQPRRVAPPKPAPKPKPPRVAAPPTPYVQPLLMATNPVAGLVAPMTVFTDPCSTGRWQSQAARSAAVPGTVQATQVARTLKKL